MKFNPLTPIEVSGSFTIPDEQVTQIFGDTSDVVQKFTLTFPIPTNCSVRNGEVYYGEHKIGMVNESDPTKMDMVNAVIESSSIDEEGMTLTFRQVE